MAVVEIRGLNELIRGINILERRHIPIVLAKTLTDIAWIAKRETVEEMTRVFDSPTPFTLNALQVDKATVANHKSRVWFKSQSRVNDKPHYLVPQVEGQNRSFKKFESALFNVGVLPRGYYTVPASGADIDNYGNMKKGQIIQIMSYFRAFQGVGYRSDSTPETRARLARNTRSRYGIAYFVIQPGHPDHSPGIYKRINSNFGTAIKPVLLFVNAVNYRPRLNIQRIADKTYRDNFNQVFNRNFEVAVNNALPG